MISDIAGVCSGFLRRVRRAVAVPPLAGALPVLAALLGGLLSPVSAAPVGSQQAFTAASHWLRLSPQPMARALGTPARLSSLQAEGGAPLCHVVEFDPVGYVVIAADDEQEPVIAFSHEDRFVAEPGHPLFELLRRDLAHRRGLLRTAAVGARPGAAAVEMHRRKWDVLLSRGNRIAAVTSPGDRSVLRSAAIDDVRVEPLVRSRWGQGAIGVNGSSVAVYNYYTPPHAAGDPRNYPSGCTATAVAQIFRYHQWPRAAVGTASCDINVDGTRQQRTLRGGDGSGGPYDWANMVLEPGASITAAQRMAIGALMHDVGIALSTAYTASGSGALSSFPEGLQYPQRAWVFVGDDPAGLRREQLLIALRTNLDAALPVKLSIAGKDEGHAVVCDGYGYNQGTLYHHLNMGWSGANDAWYNLPVIDDSYYGFDAVTRCDHHIAPAAVGEIVSGRIAYADGTPAAGITVTFSGGSSRTATTNQRGIFAVTGIPSGTTWTITPRADGHAFIPARAVVDTTHPLLPEGNGAFTFGVGDRVADFIATKTGAGSLEVPVITWSQPSPIFAGVALSATELNATANVPGTFSYSPAAGALLEPGTHVLAVTFTPADGSRYSTAATQVSLVVLDSFALFTVQPQNQVAPVGGSVVLTPAFTAALDPALQWWHDGVAIAGATSQVLTISNLQPADAGLYQLVVTCGPAKDRKSVASDLAIVGIASTTKVVGSGSELVPVDIRHRNGNIFDQVLLTGVAETITADPGQVTRTSFLDLDDDIVQVEFTGPGALTLVLDEVTAAAPPAKYNQNVSYMKGNARIIVTGADEHTHLTVFSVGRGTAVDQGLFKPDVEYDGIVDLASVSISSRNGRFGGLRTSNVSYFARTGITGVYAPGVTFTGPVYVGDIVAYEGAIPMLLLGGAENKTQINGGDLSQPTGMAVLVCGLSRLEFVAGTDSHDRRIEAKQNKALLLEVKDGQYRIVTDQVVVNP